VDHTFYFNRLYPFQDRILGILNEVDTAFYLTGGTAASRGYLQHRFSDDLDLFVNDDERFGVWSDRLIQVLLQRSGCQVDVLLREARFVRLNLFAQDIALKIELVNDVPAYVGQVRSHPVLGRLDSPENILANKITALIDREEPKDLADVWGFCCRMGLSLNDAISGAQGKAAGIFPLDLARILCSVSRKDWEIVRWIEAPDVDQFVADLYQLGEQLILPEEGRA
jgi:hypothetical protein